MPRLTKSFIESQSHPTKGQIICRDEDLPGFALRITPSCKSFVVESNLNGVRKRITLGKYGVMGLETARATARQLLGEMSLGAKIASSGTSQPLLKDVMEKYLSERTMKEETKDNYRRLMRRLLGDWLELPVNAITSEMVTVRHRELVRPTRCGTDNKACANTVMQFLKSLFHFADYGYPQPLVKENPVLVLNKRRQWYRVEPRQGVIPDHRLADFVQALMAEESKIARDFVLTLLFTGLRRTEASTLLVSNCDFDKRTLTIPAAETKNGREHVLPLSEFMVALLESRRPFMTQYVFPGRIEGHINEPRAVLARLRKQLGWNWILHDLRRTFLSTGEKCGLPYLVLQKLANHTVHRDPTDRYIVLDHEYLREPVNQITSRLLALMGMTAAAWKELDSAAARLPAPAFRTDVYREDHDEFYW